MATTKAHRLDDLFNNDIKGSFPYLIEIYNPYIIWTQEEKDLYGQEDFYFRVVSNSQNVVYRGKTWIAASFEINMPESTGTSIGTSTLKINAIDARIRKMLRIIDSTCKFSIVALFSKYEKEEGSNNYVYQFFELRTVDMILSSANLADGVASFSLVFENITQQQTPFDVATGDRVPSISEADL